MAVEISASHVHDLRHTFVMWLQNVGTEYEVPQVFVGHRMPGTTDSHSHGEKASDVKVREAVDKLVEKLQPVQIIMQKFFMNTQNDG